MTLINLILLVFLIGMIAGAALCYLIIFIRKLEKAIQAPQNRQRLPYKVNDGLEDAIAVLMELQQESDYLQVRMKQVHKILAVLRGSPDEYDPDAPNGKRSQ